MVWQSEKVVRTNFCSTPNFTAGTTGWVGTNSTVSRDTTSAMDTAGSLKVTGSGTASNDSYAYHLVVAATTNKYPGLAANKVYTFSADAKLGAAFTGAQNPTFTGKIVVYVWAASLGGLQTYTSDAATTVKSRLSVTVTIPADATGWAFRLYNGSVSASDVIYWDNVLVEQAGSAQSYFDGSTAALTSPPFTSYRWQGTVNASVSEQYLPQQFLPTYLDSNYIAGNNKAGYEGTYYVDYMDIQNFAFGISKVAHAVPEMRGNHTSIPGRSGVIPRFNRSYNEGELNLSMWVIGCNPDGSVPAMGTDRYTIFKRNLQSLLTIFGAQNGLMYLLWTAPDQATNPEVYMGAPLSSQAISNGITSLETMMARQRAELTVSLTLVNSFWSTAGLSIESTTASATLPQNLTLKSMGSAPVEDSVITITGPVAIPRVACLSQTGDNTGIWVQYNGNLAAGKNLIIDAGKGTATIDGVSVISQISHGGHARLMYIPPRKTGGVPTTPMAGASVMVLTGSGGASTTKLQVSYVPKFLVGI